MHVVQVNAGWDRSAREPDVALARYPTLTGFAEALAAAGARVTIVQRFRRPARERQRRVEYVFRPRVAMLGAVAAAHAAVVHVHGLVFPATTWLLRKAIASDTPILVQDHGNVAPVRSCPPAAWRQRLRTRALAAADGFVFAAAGQADPWRSAGVIRADHAIWEVMESAPALSRISRDDARRASGIDGSPALLWVGRLNANKDPMTVLRAFEQVVERLPRATLTIVHQGGDLTDAVAMRGAAFGGRVRIVGAVPHAQLAAYYSAADLFVLGSHHEGSGYALLEACACGAVPVVTSIPSFRAITGNGDIGALWLPGDVDSCARAIVGAAGLDVHSMSARAVRRMEAEFGWPALARRMIDVYESARRLRARSRARRSVVPART